ncbi:N-glycosylase/DNA lyase [Brachyistius frenatus]|uniref:N-glycosylase/DNA lyase n=1 Tax=Brachyistius frenatus TaxID=100188 RepID=UPI0037E82243
MAKHAVLSSGDKMWRSMACSKLELRLDFTLACGQSFRWRETADGHWTGVMGGRVWTLTQTDDTLWYHVYKKQDKQEMGGDGNKGAGVSLLQESKAEKRFKGAVKKEEDEPLNVTLVERVEEDMLRDYFQLDVKLVDLYKEWGEADCHFKHIANIFTGVRMLRQDPTECLFSIICTSNNNVSRIQGMVDRLCEALGAPLCQLDQTSYYDFPTLSSLADDNVEACLRELRFGYRARFLQQSAKQILDTQKVQWLDDLRTVPYLEACDALRTLPGVGTKVANCVCLMSLDKLEAVPIDTHMWQIAKRDYKYGANNRQKSITDQLHRDIGDFFRKLWGPYAGWAQSVLFCADLQKFKSLKERAHLKQPKKEEEDDEGGIAECKKTKIKREYDGTVKTLKAKSACHKKAKMSVKKEKVV